MKRIPKIEMPSIDPTLLPKSEKMNQEEEKTQQEPRAGPSKEPEKRTKPVGVTKKDPLAIEMEAEHLQLVESTAVTFNPGKPKAKGSRTGKEAQQKPMEGSSKESKNSKVKRGRKRKIDPVKIEMEAECHQPDEPKTKRSGKQELKDPLAISSKELTAKKARKRKADPPEDNCMQIVKNPAALVGPKGKRSRKQAPIEPVAGPSKSRSNQSTKNSSQTQLAMNSAAVPGFPKKKQCRPAYGSSKTKKIHPLRKSFDCTYCSVTYSTKRRLMRHWSTHYSEKIFLCSICGGRFTHGDGLRKHNVKLHKINFVSDLECVFCPESRTPHTFRTEMDLMRHCQVEHINKISKKRRLKRNKSTHLDRPTRKPLQPLYQCRLCSKTTRDRRDLHRHEVTHIQLCLYACPIESCRQAPFTQANHIRKHIAAEHPRFRRKHFRCGVCFRIFPTERFLLNHALNEHLDQQQPVDPHQQPQQKPVEDLNPLAVVPFVVHPPPPVVPPQHSVQQPFVLLTQLADVPFGAHQPPPPAIVPPKKRRTMIDSETSVRFALYLDSEPVDPTREMDCVVCQDRFVMSNYSSHVILHHNPLIIICACALCKEKFGNRANEMYKHRKDVHPKQGLAVRVKLFTTKQKSGA